MCVSPLKCYDFIYIITILELQIPNTECLYYVDFIVSKNCIKCRKDLVSVEILDLLEIFVVLSKQ